MIEVEHLSKLYGLSPAIQDVTFTVEPGEILGFLGPNGAGKTTTMRILTGYLPATSGTARVAGFDVHDDSIAVRQRIGYLPETPPLYPEMTVKGFLYFVARIKGVAAGNRTQQVQMAMKRCNLEDKANTLIRKLSKGYRQRVGIAQAIVHDPPVIILDEPTVGLDPRQIIDVRNLIKSLAGDHTIILSTHILPEAQMICDRITIINQGHVVATNNPSELVKQLQGSVQYELEIEGNLETATLALKTVDAIEQIETLTIDSSLPLATDTKAVENHVENHDPVENDNDNDVSLDYNSDQNIDSNEQKMLLAQEPIKNNLKHLSPMGKNIENHHNSKRNESCKNTPIANSEEQDNHQLKATTEDSSDIRSQENPEIDTEDHQENSESFDNSLSEEKSHHSPEKTENLPNKNKELETIASHQFSSSEPDSDSDSQKRESLHQRLRVSLHPGYDVGPDIAKVLVEAGLNLYEMRRTQASLEEVFLALTTTDLID